MTNLAPLLVGGIWKGGYVQVFTICFKLNLFHEHKQITIEVFITAFCTSEVTQIVWLANKKYP